MDTVEWYRWFAEHEAEGSSPSYERLALMVADDAHLVAWLRELPGAKRRPNLFFSAVRFLGGPTDDVDAFASFVDDHADDVAATMRSRAIQTNEVARCATFVPVLGALDTGVALIEVGASAGLCLYPDRYAYSYSGHDLGESSLVIALDATGPIPIPARLPEVVARAGIDLHPLDATDPDDAAWLRACVWPEHEDRRRNLDRALEIVAADPPRIERGDVSASGTELIAGLIDEAPADATKVVFHSALLPYVDEPSRVEFGRAMRDLVDARDDVVWLSNEAPPLVPGLPAPPSTNTRSPGRVQYHLGRNGTDVLAVADSHGRWLDWL